MENFGCSEGRPPDGGVPDILMAGDVAEDYNDADIFGEMSGQSVGVEGTGGDHVDIETCDQQEDLMEPTEIDPNIKSEPEEEEEEKEPLNYELAQGNRILVEIMSDANKSLNWPFMEPVDAEGMGLTDYYDRVKNPMWLKKIMSKFDQRAYTTITEFAADFRLMLENCYRYNGPDHYVSKRGQKLETVFEQKLGLLSRDLREKTSIAATSGKPIEDKIITGTRRRKILTPHDSSDLLNQLRQEEKERERETRRQQVEERRQQQQAFVQELTDWDNMLLGPGGQDYLKGMWELPQIGHFLFLTADVLNIGEVMQFELERSFWMPRQAQVMQSLMTSLLSTPYQRTRLESKPPMPYAIWEDKLRTRVRNWYKIFNENNRDTKKIHQKLGLDETFFKVVGLTNPLETRKFHDLTFYQRIWIVKGLCDWCLETQESVREALESQPVVEQREYGLGTDAEGNTYIHFPQFCGQDLRVYRVSPIPMPKRERAKPTTVEQTQSPKKKGRSTKKSKPAPQTQTARLRQSARQAASSTHSESSNSSSDSGISESEASEHDAPLRRAKTRRQASPAPSTQSTGSTAPNTPTKGRSSRTSAAARDWMPRDGSALGELTGRRGSRSQRLTCAPVNSGTSTPTTTATPSGSRESTPVPTAKDRSSRSSTPSMETSSRASSPVKQPTSRSRSRRKRRRKVPQRKKPGEKEEQSEDGEEEENDAGSIEGEAMNNADGVVMPDGSVVEALTTNDPMSSSTPTPCPPSIRDPDQEDNSNSSIIGHVDGGVAETGDAPTAGTPFSSYGTTETGLSIPNTEGDSQLVPAGGEGETVKLDTGLSDNKASCDMDSACDGPEPHSHLLPNDHTKGSLSTPHHEPNETNALNCVPQSTSTNHSVLCKCEVKEETGECTIKQEDMQTDCEGKPQVGLGCQVTPDKSCVKSEPCDNQVTCTPGELALSISNVTVKSEPGQSQEVKSECVGGEVGMGDTAVKEEPMEVPLEAEVKEEPMEVPPEAAPIKQEEEVEPEIKFPEVGRFLLVADSVDMLRQLSLQFAEPEPIIEIKGKKEKVIRPPPRKRCVSDLYERLCYLLKELEPWESKLVAVNKKARIKLRKEFESYVEEQEMKVVEDVWESEESQSEDSDEDSEDNEDEEIVEVKKEPVKSMSPVVTPSPVKTNQKVPKKTTANPPPMSAAMAAGNNNTVSIADGPDHEKSSFGRVRKRKVIPNSYDEPPVNKKGKKGKEKEHSPSPTPNILQSSRAKSKAPQSNIESLRTALSRAKPVSTASALPPGMQLLNIGGQNVLLNTNTNPPVILQTSAPLNLNNLTLLAQLSAKAAAGNALGSKIVMNSGAAAGSGSAARPTGPVTTVSTASSTQPPQQVIRTLLAAGHAPQHPKTRTLQPAVAASSSALPTRVTTAPSGTSSSGAVQQLTFVHSPMSSNPTAVTALSSALPRAPTPATVPQLAGQSLLQPAQGAGDASSTRPQFYKYNDLSQMKATIRQQLVKTSQGVRTKTTVSTGYPGTTALTNLIQAGLLPQTPRMTSAMLQPAPAHLTLPQSALPVPQPSPPQATPPEPSPVNPSSTQPASVSTATVVKAESELGSLEQEMPEELVSPPVARTTIVTSVESKPHSILSQVLANTGPPQTTNNIPIVSTQSPTKTAQLACTPTPTPQMVLMPGGGIVLKSPPNTQTAKAVTILPSPPKSPISISTATPCSVAPTSTADNTSGIQPVVKAQLSPEFKEAVKMGIVNEFNIGSLINSNPGLVKALNNTMRPKYASNVTVKSLLESRALRQKAQRQGEEVVSPVKSPPPLSYPAEPAISPYKVENMTIYTQNDKSVGIQLHSRTSPNKLTTVSRVTPSTSATIVSSPSLVPGIGVQKPKTGTIQVKGVAAGRALQTRPLGATKAPIQIQAVRTPQGTILRAPVRQQVVVRPGVQAGTQQVVRLVTPGPGGTAQITALHNTATATLPSTTPAQTPALPTTLLTLASGRPANLPQPADQTLPADPLPQTSSLDEVVKSVVTTVHCSIPTAQIKIVSPFTAPGHQPLRQVTMTTSAMKSPIPSITALTSSQQSVGEEKVTSTVSTAPAKITSPTSVTQARVVPTVVQSASGQKNVILRVVPQQVMTSEGMVNMILPQQVLQQSLKVDGGGSGKLVLQTGKGGLQLVQAAGQTGVQTAGLPVGLPSVQQVAKHNPTPNTALLQGLATQQHTGTATSTSSSGRTVMTVFPPGKQKGDTGVATAAQAHAELAVNVNKQQSQVTLVPQRTASATPSPVHFTNTDTSIPGTVISSPPTVSSLPPQTVLVQKGSSAQQQLQTLQQAVSVVKPSVVGVGHPNVRVVSPQLTLSSAGLVPVQVPAVRHVESKPQLQPAPRPVAVQSHPGSVQALSAASEQRLSPVLLEQTAMAEATSSLDLLAAASMLREAKAPLPTQPQVQVAQESTQPETGIQQKQVSVPQPAPTLALHSAVTEGQTLMAVPSSQPPNIISPVESSATLLQQAKAMDQRVKLQQQVLEEQQKQQKLIIQPTLQQEGALVGGSLTGTVPTQATKTPTSLTSPAAKALVTTPNKKTAMPASNVPATPGVQMAGVMASAGGRMVQLRFAVPTGMNVQQLLQTPQFQQQLAALKVSAIHSITTSTVAATTTTAPTAAVATPTQNPTSAQVVLSSAGGGQVAGSALNNLVTTRAIATAQPRAVTPNPIKPAMTPTALVSPAKPAVATLQRATTAGGLPAASVGGGQQGNKVTVLVNVNGQLMQAQGLSLGNNMRVVGSTGVGLASTTLTTTQASTGGQVQRLVHTGSQGTKVLQTVGSLAQPRLVTATSQPLPQQLQPSTPHKFVIGGATTPQKIVVRGPTTPQKVVIGRPAVQQNVVVGGPTTHQKTVIRAPAMSQRLVLGTPTSTQKVVIGGTTTPQKGMVGGQQAMLVAARAAGGNLVSPVRTLQGLTVHNPAAAAVKTNLLTQLTARAPQLTSATNPAGIILTRPVIASNANLPVIHNITSSAGAPTTPNNTNLPNGK